MLSLLTYLCEDCPQALIFISEFFPLQMIDFSINQSPLYENVVNTYRVNCKIRILLFTFSS